MKLRAPEFWNHKKGPQSAPFLTALLSPLGWLYAYLTARRIKQTTPLDVGVPVICVGNATAGGTGKTPVTAHILSMLSANKIRAYGLSRGYGGRERGPLLVTSQHSAADIGDEPLLLARQAPIWVAAGRDEGARAAVSTGAQVIVMDDGHQNPILSKTLSLLVVDAETGFGNERVIPAGPLREPVSEALTRSDAIILMKPYPEYKPEAHLMTHFKGMTVLEAYLAPQTPLPNGPLLAFAGIGRPEKFFNAIKRAGGKLVQTQNYADHHNYSEDDLKNLQAMAREYRSQLITTEKDFVRLPAGFQQYVAVWPVTTIFQNELLLDRLLTPIIEQVKQTKRHI